MKYYHLIPLFILVRAFFRVTSQTQESVKISGDKDTCNVVNVNCGGSRHQTLPIGVSTEPRLHGPPGKRGRVGEQGPRGPKGNTGERGIRGKPGSSVDISEIRKQIMNSIGALSCEDLMENRGISESGFYILRSIQTSQLRYVYCSFETGVSTCNQLRNSQEVNETGLYIVRPDMSSPSFQIFCNFTAQEAITEIWHENMEEIHVDGNCESQGCYSWIPNYSLGQDQLTNIISQSRECRQFVQFRCKGVLIFRDGHGYWISRDGEKMKYWGGAISRRDNYCACGETRTCVDNNFKCNCDNNQIKISTSDEGYLTDKTKLPLKELRFGDNGDPGEMAWFTVGKLECMG